MVLLCIFAFVRTGSVALCGIAAAAFLIPVVGWAMALLASRSFSASLACATTTAKESPVTATLTLANESVFPVACVRAVVNARNLLTSQAMTTQVNVSCGPRSTVDVPLEFSSALCGRVECAVESVQLFDPFRLFSRTVACSAQRRFTVMPGLHDVLLRDVYAASPLSDTTVFSPYAKGTDLSEVFGLREYEAGDELKRIHWKLSEKLDQMIVRDASLPLDNALLLFWDKNLSSTATGASPGSDEAAHRADAMAEVMLALMEQLARADVTFEVASNDIPASRCIRAFMTDENDIYELILKCDNILGLGLGAPDPEETDGTENAVDPALAKEVEEQIALRLAAKKAKNYAEADRIRNELAAKGIILTDTPQGTTWKKG